MGRFIKDIILSVLINAGILFGLSYYKFGMVIETDPSNQVQAYLILGFIFWIVNFGVKKIIYIVSSPLRWLSFGLVTVIINIGILYAFQNYINKYYSDIATITLSTEWIKVLILSFVISFVYGLLSKILK